MPGGPGGISNSGTATLQNTIIAQNNSGGIRDFGGAAISLGNNLIGQKAQSTGWIDSDLLDIDARLGPLEDNGGPTLTHALLVNSPAIDAGNNSGAPATDQRGNRRPRDGNGDGSAVVDIGAFELALGQAGVEAAPDTATVNEDSTNNMINVVANDTGISGSTLLINNVTTPAHGNATIAENRTNVLYTPDPNYAGTDSFAYTVSDDQGRAATAMVTITVTNADTDWQGMAGDDVFLVRRDGPGLNIQVFTNSEATGTPIFSMPIGSVSFLAFETLGGDDRLIVDLVNGSPMPTGGIQYVGGANGNLGDQLNIRDAGTTSAIYTANSMTQGNGVVTVGGRNITLTDVEPIDVSGLNAFTVITPNATDTLSMTSPVAGTTQLSCTSGPVVLSPVTVTNIATVIIDTATNDAGAGNDSLTIAASGVIPNSLSFVQYRSGTGANTLTVQSGTARIDSTVAATGTLDTTVAQGAAIVTHRFQQTSLNLGNGSRASVIPDGTSAGTSALNALNINNSATLDLADNDLVIKTTAANKPALLSALYDRLKSGYAGGTWNGNCLASSVAQCNTDTTLSLVDNAILGLTQFSGEPVDANSLLLKYTYYGDIDQNGAVDADDLTVFANNFGRTSGATQVDGDIDFNGAVDADDLTVFANNFNKGAGAPLAAVIGQVVRGELSRRTKWRRLV